MTQKTVAQHALRFAATGLLNTAIDFAIFSILVFEVQVHIVAANILAFLGAVTVSYFVNKFWTFSDRTSGRGRLHEWISFIIISIGGLILATIALYLLAQFLPVMVAKVIATGASFTWNFLLVRTHLWKH